MILLSKDEKKKIATVCPQNFDQKEGFDDLGVYKRWCATSRAVPRKRNIVKKDKMKS